MKGRSIFLAFACLLLAAAAWFGWQVQRGPELSGYEVTAGPLVQTVVATGRVAALISSASKSAQTLAKMVRSRLIASPSNTLRRYFATKTKWAFILKTQCRPCLISLSSLIGQIIISACN